MSAPTSISSIPLGVRLNLRPCPRTLPRTRVRRSPQSAGFTLIEVLVSVAVLGVLAGLSFTAIGGSVRAARQSKCSSNLRQLALATAQYSDANKRLLPLARDRIDVRLGNIAPLPALEPFLGVPAPRLDFGSLVAADVLRCPEDRTVFHKQGCSYDYMPGAMMMVSLGPDTQREVSSMYWRDELPDFLWKDADAFHVKSVPGGILAAWPDGSVRPRPMLGVAP